MNKLQKAKKAFPTCKPVVPSGFARAGKDVVLITTDESRPRVIAITGDDLWTLKSMLLSRKELAAELDPRKSLKK